MLFSHRRRFAVQKNLYLRPPVASASMASAVQTEVRKEPSVIGLPLKRMEDPKFITGTGRFVEDVVLPNVLYGVFVRSLHAHARILSVDVSQA